MANMTLTFISLMGKRQPTRAAKIRTIHQVLDEDMKQLESSSWRNAHPMT